MLPWLADHVEETVRTMGEDYWTYGVEPNRAVLETFLRYSREQGLARRRWTPDEIFTPGAAESYLV
jgi:4,5-dihydroxyphthalate decarboxylase